MSKAVEIAALAIRLQTARETLALLARSASDREAGRKALLLAFLFDPKLVGSQRELAKRMGVTEGRCSQMLKVFRKRFAHHQRGADGCAVDLR